MRALDAIVVWTPNRENQTAYPTRGKIKVFSYGDQDDPYYPSSVGACDADWSATDEAGRLALMQRCVTRMLYEDKLELDAVKAALAQIEEFAHFPFSTKPPPLPKGD